MDAFGFWQEFNTDWACLDCELMPWSAKAHELLRQQYAAVGTAARVGIANVNTVLQTEGYVQGSFHPAQFGIVLIA